MHSGVDALLSYFAFEHLPEGLKQISKSSADLAHEMAQQLPDGPEKTAGIRKLLEAKDCFVRAALPAPPPQGRQEDTADVPWFPLR